MSEKKEKARDGYDIMYECGKHFCLSSYEHTCTSKALLISKMEERVSKYKSEYEDILEQIIFYHKELERRAAYLEQSTADFVDAANITANITVNSDSLLTQGKNSANENIEN